MIRNVAALGLRKARCSFRHGARHDLSPTNLAMFDSLHCSRLNTNTKRLTHQRCFTLYLRMFVICLGLRPLRGRTAPWPGPWRYRSRATSRRTATAKLLVVKLDAEGVTLPPDAARAVRSWPRRPRCALLRRPVARGRELYQQTGCERCHGEDGRSPGSKGLAGWMSAGDPQAASARHRPQRPLIMREKACRASPTCSGPRMP